MKYLLCASVRSPLKTQMVIYDFWQIFDENLLRQKQCYGVSQKVSQN